MSKPEAQVQLNIIIEARLKTELEELAARNDRTLSAEVRRALRIWLLTAEKRNGPQEAA